MGEYTKRVDIMNKGELVEHLAKKTGYTKTQVTEVVNEMIYAIGKTVKKGDKVQ
jgi:nucleoid DNA-binding protein